MKNMTKIAILACLCAAASAQAAVYTGSFSSTDVWAQYGPSNVRIWANDNQGDYGSSSSTSTLPGFSELYLGVGGGAQSSATADELNASSSLNWDTSVPVGGMTPSASTASGASLRDDLSFEFSGKVRFKLDYTLESLGFGTSSNVSFYATVNSVNPYGEWWNSINSSYLSFYESVYFDGWQTSKTGSWTSDWYDFTNTTDLNEANPWSWYQSMNAVSYQLQVYNSTNINASEPSGSNSALVSARLSYEILPVTAPIPEPETYALMLAGIGMVGAVARRRSK